MKLKAGRKPLPPEKKKHLVAAYLTKDDKTLIINRYGSLTQAVVHEILSKIHANGHSNSTWDWESVAR
jgi:hypothetical protein